MSDPKTRARLGARLRRLVLALPGLHGLHETLQRTRAERDALRAQQDALSAQRDALRAERDALRRQTEDLQSALRRPSFVALLARSQRDRARAREEHGWRDPVWDFNPKLAGYALADELGVPRPEVFWTGTDLTEVDFAALPDRAVVKPTDGSSARGVFPLVRLEGEAFHSLYDGHVLTSEELAERLRALHLAGHIGPELLIEELVGHPDDPDALPHDWKVYCFGGRAELVLQKDPCNARTNDIARFKFYDRAWCDLGPLRMHELVDPALPPPQHPDELLAAAETVACFFDRPFLRVDLFDGPDGVRFCELTPVPGGDQWHGAPHDERLGAAWEAVELRLRVMGRGREGLSDGRGSPAAGLG